MLKIEISDLFPAVSETTFATLVNFAFSFPHKNTFSHF